MRVAIVGGGIMGEAILSAALERGVFAPGEVLVAEVIEARRNELHVRHGVRTTAAAADAMQDADLAILSVKPQDVKSVGGALPEEALLLSVMAGVRLETLAREFGHQRIIRVMPNTPVAVRAGMSVWTATEAVTQAQLDLARGLLGAIGEELYVTDEAKIDMATAVSGSGPAYVFLFIEALVEGAVAVGLTRAQAQQIVTQTVYGSALYANQSEASPGDLRAQVTSPAGTTAAGLLELERGALRAAVIECVRAAHRRAVELGKDG